MARILKDKKAIFLFVFPGTAFIYTGVGYSGYTGIILFVM